MNAFRIAVGAVMPMALLMGIGMALRLTGVTDRETMKKVDTISYRLLIPMLLFYNIYNADFRHMEHTLYIWFAMFVLAVLFLFALFAVPRFEHDPRTAASLGQVIVRPNYLIFGVVVAESIYGKGQIGTMALLGAVGVPVFNAMSAIILEAGTASRSSFRSLMASILKNPMVLAALMGLAVNFSGLHMPAFAEKVVSDLSDMSTPLSFLSLGVSLNFATVSDRLRPLLIGTVGKLVAVPAMFLPLAILLGIRGQELCSLLIFCAAPTAVAGYPMAVAMGADGELAGQAVVFTTLFSLFTIFLWILLFSSLALL